MSVNIDQWMDGWMLRAYGIWDLMWSGLIMMGNIPKPFPLMAFADPALSCHCPHWIPTVHGNPLGSQWAPHLSTYPNSSSLAKLWVVLISVITQLGICNVPMLTLSILLLDFGDNIESGNAWVVMYLCPYCNCSSAKDVVRGRNCCSHFIKDDFIDLTIYCLTVIELYFRISMWCWIIKCEFTRS